MPKTSFHVVLVLLCVFAGSAFADIHQFQYVPLTLPSWEGYYISPYTVKDLTTGENLGLALSVYCDDFDHTMATKWYADVNPLDEDLASKYRYTDASVVTPPDAFTRYVAAAWLFGQIQTATVGSLYHQELQVAAWTLFDSGTTLQAKIADYDLTHPGFSAAVQGDYGGPVGGKPGSIDADDGLLSLAMTNAATIEAFYGNDQIANWYVFTPVSCDANGQNCVKSSTISQEVMWSKGSGNIPVPEPASIVLLGTLLLGLGHGLSRRWAR